MNVKRRYNYAFAIMTIMATWAVVMLHGSSYVFANTGDNLWKNSLVIQAVFIPAVPIFFMMSGANLLDYSSKYSTATFIKKRLGRVGVAFLAFSAIWYIYNHINGHEAFSVLNFIKELSNNQINQIFWYFYALFICYLMTPLLTAVAHNKRILQYLILVLFTLGTCVPFINHFLNESVFNPVNLSLLVNNGLLYYILGYYLSKYIRPLHKKEIYIAVLAMFIIVPMSWYASMIFNLRQTVPYQLPYNNFWIDAFGLNITIYSVLLFVCLNQISVAKTTSYIENLLKLVAKSSLLVYGIHYIVLDQMDKLYVSDNVFLLLWVRPVVAFIISTAISIAYYTLTKQIKKKLKTCASNTRAED